MKAIKIYLLVVSCMLLFALGMGVYVWYTYQKSLEPAGTPDTPITTSETA